jgi:endonuclease III
MKTPKTRFDTHVKRLSNRINLKEENIIYYCLNNNCSDSMTKRLIQAFKSANKEDLK